MKTKKISKFNAKILSLFLVISIFSANLGVIVHAAGNEMYDFNSDKKPTEQQVIEIAEKYDTDGAFFLKAAQKNEKYSESFIEWFTSGNYSRNFNLDYKTTVHEMTHEFQFAEISKKGAGYYIGAESEIIFLKEDEVFKTEEWSDQMPAKLRTFRYNPYVTKGTILASNEQGAYGLLYELQGYFYGAKSSYALWNYYLDYAKTAEQFVIYLRDLYDDSAAYAEFKYYMLGYLLYAKSNHPEDYKKIMANKDFLRVYNITEQSYANLIYNLKNLRQQEVLNVAKKRGFEIFYKDGSYFYDKTKGYNFAMYEDDYNLLMGEINKPEFKALDAEIKAMFPNEKLQVLKFDEKTIAVEAPQKPENPKENKENAEIIALSSNSPVIVNNAKKSFEAYNIGGSNYFKLRDLAQVLNATSKQFEIGYDGAKNAIMLENGKKYTPNGSELIAGDGLSKKAIKSSAKIYFNGKEISLTAYNIGGNNYFKLRDIMRLIDVFVGYNSIDKIITIDTNKSYEDN